MVVVFWTAQWLSPWVLDLFKTHSTLLPLAGLLHCNVTFKHRKSNILKLLIVFIIRIWFKCLFHLLLIFSLNISLTEGSMP